MSRPLWQTLVDLVEAVLAPADSEIRVRDAYIDLPLEVRVQRRGNELEFLADVPRWRWETVFDEKRGRLKLKVGGDQAL
jgi:hypothetical protein